MIWKWTEEHCFEGQSGVSFLFFSSLLHALRITWASLVKESRGMRLRNTARERRCDEVEVN